MGNSINIKELANLDRIEVMLVNALAEVCRVKKSLGFDSPAVPAKKQKKHVVSAVDRRRSRAMNRNPH